MKSTILYDFKNFFYPDCILIKYYLDIISISNFGNVVKTKLLD